MPLQNRVDPFGAIYAVSARGLFIGNRGVIHDPATKTLLSRRWTTRAWIVCDCAFRGRRRDVMGRNAPSGGAGWTELFFLDEVTALAAGHRPCFFCRRAAAVDFTQSFAQGQGRDSITAPEIDAILHAERRASHKQSASTAFSADEANALPPGAMILSDGQPLARHARGWLAWSFDGWAPATAAGSAAVLITPPATIAALRAGYLPVWHSTAAHPRP